MSDVSHYALVTFEGDFDPDGHPDPELRGKGPMVTYLVARGDEKHCAAALAAWTAEHPLRRGEIGEVVARTTA
jgi:hypothetical protein